MTESADTASGAASAARLFARLCSVPPLLLLLPLDRTLPMRSKILLPNDFGDSTRKPEVTRAASKSSSVIICMPARCELPVLISNQRRCLFADADLAASLCTAPWGS